MGKRYAVLGVVLASILLATIPALCQYQPVTDARLLKAAPQDWLQYGQNYFGHHYSSLKQINTMNVKSLVPVWAYSTDTRGGHQSSVIENSGIAYVTAAYNKLYAIDVKTGKLLWKYERDIPEKALSVVCCDVVNRGVALYGDKVYMGTIDAHVVAFDAMTGKIVFDQEVADYHDGITITNAPLAYKGKIITGMTGGEFGARGRLIAIDAESGKIDWITYTVPEPGQPGSETWPKGDEWKTGGGTTWSVGAIDPALNTIYWGTGNPGPWQHTVRPGDNLYTASAVAFDADTGAIKGAFQVVPHDEWDYDNITPPVLVDTVVKGKAVKGLYQAEKAGYGYLLNRADLGMADGKGFIYGEPLYPITFATGLNAKGRPIFDPAKDPAEAKVEVCPSFLGGTNWMPLAYDPTSSLMFLPGNDWCEDIKDLPHTPFEKGKAYVQAEFHMHPAPNALGAGGNVQAVDVRTGKRVWQTKFEEPIWSGALATGGGLVFVGGTASRNFMALDSKTGKVIWSFPTNSGITGVPTTFEVGGKQYVGIVSGYGGAIPLWTGMIHEKYTKDVPQGGVIWMFALK